MHASGSRAELETRWLELTRDTLPAMAQARGFPVRADHCFQRIFLDAACGGPWYGHVTGRPAYRHIAETKLAEAVRLVEGVVHGKIDLANLNRESLAGRRSVRRA